MKRLNSLFTVAMLAVSMVVVSLAATSCSNDDDNNNGGGESSILGTWSGRNDESLNTLTFKKDGTGTWVSQDYDSFWGTETETGTFSYEMIDESTGTFTIKLYYSDSELEIEHYNFRIEGKKMYVHPLDWGYSAELILHKK
ncbi:MAG: hypothetical protein K2J84_08610 [Bacteroidaceae bacterium]|nr:hypothetical protein [Bacteroidaceae bacterium]